MNAVLKHILNAAINYEKTESGCLARNSAMDVMYEKLIVRPVQKLWIQYRHNYCLCCYQRDKFKNIYNLQIKAE
jgi:hypothetical protein